MLVDNLTGIHHPEPCQRCKVPTFGTFGSQPYCLACLRQTRDTFRRRIAARQEPQYAPGILRCDQCDAIRPDGGEAPGGYQVWHEYGVHGASEQEDSPEELCNGRMRRVPLRQAEQQLAQTDDVA